MLKTLNAHCLARFKNTCFEEHLFSKYTWSYYRKYSKVTNDSDSGEKVSEADTSIHPDGPREDPSTSYQGESAEKLLEQSRLDKDDVLMEFPSDVDDYSRQFKNYNAWKRDQQKHAFRPKVDPLDTSVLLFPGQGSQFVGMGKELLEYPNVLEMYQVAGKILGYDLLDLCLHGPKEKLDRTEFCQPAILVTSLAAVEKLRCEKPKAVESCITALGFSVGEIAALVFAGSFSFEEAVRLVQVRAKAMQNASEQEPSGMMTVFFNANHKINFACLAAREYCKERLGIEEPVCEVANYLYPGCKVIAGHDQALQFIEKIPREFGIKRLKRLPVSGAFHTKLMFPATTPLRQALDNIHIELPAISVHSNVDSYRYDQQKVMKKYLVQQVHKPVLWEQILHIVYSRKAGDTFPYSYELGPGKQLGALLRMVNKKAYTQYRKIEV